MRPICGIKKLFHIFISRLLAKNMVAGNAFNIYLIRRRMGLLSLTVDSFSSDCNYKLLGIFPLKSHGREWGEILNAKGYREKRDSSQRPLLLLVLPGQLLIIQTKIKGKRHKTTYSLQMQEVAYTSSGNTVVAKQKGHFNQ